MRNEGCWGIVLSWILLGWLAFLVDWVWDGGDVEGGVGWARNGGDGDSSGGEGL